MLVKEGKLFDCRSAGKRKGNSGVAERQKTKQEDGHGMVPLPDIPLSSPPLPFPEKPSSRRLLTLMQACS